MLNPSWNISQRRNRSEKWKKKIISSQVVWNKTEETQSTIHLANRKSIFWEKLSPALTSKPYYIHSDQRMLTKNNNNNRFGGGGGID
jgi:uncharacterized FlgJ-related protein